MHPLLDRAGFEKLNKDTLNVQLELHRGYDPDVPKDGGSTRSRQSTSYWSLWQG